MAEEKRNITAKDLLSRLGKEKSVPSPDKKSEETVKDTELVFEADLESTEAQIAAEAEEIQIELSKEDTAEEETSAQSVENVSELFGEETELLSYDLPSTGAVDENAVSVDDASEVFDEPDESFVEPQMVSGGSPEDELEFFADDFADEMGKFFDPDEAFVPDDIIGSEEIFPTEEEASETEYEETEIIPEEEITADEAEIDADEFLDADIPDLTAEEALAFEEAAGLADYDGEDYAAYDEDAGTPDEMDEDFGGEYTGEDYEAVSADIIPDESFFDEDPLESEPEYDEYTEEYVEDGEEFEPDREEEFKSLVEEVTGDSDDTELGESDISLMVALGMEEELAKTVGEETATQMTEDYVADQEEWVDRTNRFGPGEYSDPSENGEIAEAYKKRNKFAIIKLLAASVLAIALLIIENLPVLGYQLSGALDPEVYPVVYIMIDLQLTLFCAVTVWKNIKKGLLDLLKFKVTVDTIPALVAVAAIAVAAISAATAAPAVGVSVFNFPAAVCFALTALNEYLTVRREIFSFNIVSSKKRKFVMRNLSTRDSMLESEAVSDMELDSTAADEGDIIKIQETDFVDGYFWRTKNRSTANDGYVGLAIVISLVLAVIVAVYAGISKQGSVISAGYAAFVAALPALMMVIGAYPFFVANRKAYENDSTIIGEGSVEEYSGVGVLSFDDVNVFRSQNVKVQNVRLFNNSRIDKVLYYAASVFSATGGPLCDVFDVATLETGHSDDVKVLETGTGYIEAEVNGKNIVFGRAAALAKLGIIIPDDVISDNTELSPDCSVMYMIYQRKLVSKMVVNYVIEPDFEYVLKELTGSGMCVCVKTFDPNIDEEMIYRQLHSTGKYSMRVIKYKTTDEISKYAKRSEGGIVSRGNTKALLRTVSVCDKILSAQKTGYIIGVLSAIFGAAIVAIMLISGSFANLFSLYIALCQLLWLIPAIISTRLIVK